MGILGPFGAYTTPEMKSFLLRGVSFVYLTAFASLYWQIPGLYGEKGILPIAKYFECENFPTCKGGILILFYNVLNLAPSLCLQLSCIIGMALAFLTFVWPKFHNAIVYFLLYYCYLSAYEVGGTFLWFQWDSLLLETGFLMIILSGFTSGPADSISIFLVRWLATRLMFASGVVKLQSDCPTWWGLSALDVHYESQCIPTPAAWFFHHMPQWFRRFSVAKTFYIECYLPLLFLMPFETLRRYAAVPQILFMGLIMLTGNYNFFNILYGVACMAMLEVGQKKESRRQRLGRFLYWMENALFFVAVGFITYHFVRKFGVEFDVKRWILDSEIVFGRAEFDVYVKRSTSFIIHLAVIMMVITVITSAYRCWRSQNRVSNILHLMWVTLLGSLVFWTSMVPFTYLDQSAAERVPKIIKNLHEETARWHITSSYGLFRRMTGVEGRPEVILEGASNPGGPWTEIEFYSKPGNLSTAPFYLSPHQPRLDWQMWFAALGSYHHNPWFISMVHHLMNNNRQVTRLLQNFPFSKSNPMTFARAQLSHYRFTNPGSKDWWTRSLQHEYMPVLARNSDPILDYLSQNKLIVTNKYPKTLLGTYLQKLHKYAYSVDQTYFVWGVLASAFIVLLTQRRLSHL